MLRIVRDTEARIVQVEFSVPLIPPSVNHFKERRFFSNAEARGFIDAVCVFSERSPVVGKYYEVWLTYHLDPDKFLRFDSDNFEKVSFDALARAGVIRDDRYIVDHHNSKRIATDARDARTQYLVRGKDLL